MRPKQIAPVIEQPASLRNSPAAARQTQSPRAQYIRATASPKRPLGFDDEDLNPSKRLARGVSPLKGAAGRRLDQQRRNQASALHRDITFLLGILPPAYSYDAPRLNPAGIVSLLQGTPLPDYVTWKTRTGGQYRVTTPSHGRQPSGDYQSRPLSPFGRVSSSTGGYRNSPLRTESGSYQAGGYPTTDAGAPPPGWQPPQTGYAAPPPPGQYGAYRY